MGESGYYWILGDSGVPRIAWIDKESQYVSGCFGFKCSTEDITILGPVIPFEQTVATFNK